MKGDWTFCWCRNVLMQCTPIHVAKNEEALVVDEKGRVLTLHGIFDLGYDRVC